MSDLLTKKLLRDGNKDEDGYSKKKSNRKTSSEWDGSSDGPSLDEDGVKIAVPEGAKYNPYYPAPIDEIFGDKLSESMRAGFDLYEDDYEKDELLQKVGKKVVDMVRIGARVRRKRDELVRRAVDAVLMVVPSDRESPLGEDGSNITTPTTFDPRQTLHAFFHGVVTGVRPWAKCEPISEDSDNTEAAHKQEDMLDGYLSEGEDCAFISFEDKAIASALDEGTAYLRRSWCREIDVYRDTQVLTAKNAESFGFELPEDQNLIYNGTQLKHRDKSEESVSLGTLFDGERETITKNNPALSVVSYFDYVQYPARVVDNKKATVSGRRFRMTVDEMRRGVASRLYDPEQVTALERADFAAIDDFNRTNILKGSDESVLDTHDRELFDNDIESPKPKVDIFGVSVANPYAVLEFVDVCVKMDGNGDNRSEEWVMCIETSTGIPIICRRYIGKPGEGYLIPMVIFEVPNKQYGLPIGYVLSSIQEQADVTSNLLLDAAALAMTYIIEEDQSSSDSLSTDALTIGLNHRRVDKKDTFNTIGFDMPDMKQFNAAEFLQGLSEKITAANETFSGTTGQRGQTATETQQVVNATARRLKVGVSRIQSANKEVVAGVLADIRRYALQPADLDAGVVPQSVDYALTRGGENVYGTMKISELFVDVRIRMFGDAENTDQNLKQQGAEKLFMAMERDPTFLNGSLPRRREVIAHFLDAFGVRNISSFIGTAAEAQQMQKQADATKAPKQPPIPEKADEIWMAAFMATNEPQQPQEQNPAQAPALVPPGENQRRHLHQTPLPAHPLTSIKLSSNTTNKSWRHKRQRHLTRHKTVWTLPRRKSKVQHKSRNRR
jgi:hypothetical protein